jgi:hypothetical protein
VESYLNYAGAKFARTYDANAVSRRHRGAGWRYARSAVLRQRLHSHAVKNTAALHAPFFQLRLPCATRRSTCC